jgi:hypothetical protein
VGGGGGGVARSMLDLSLILDMTIMFKVLVNYKVTHRDGNGYPKPDRHRYMLSRLLAWGLRNL